ncbi:PLP-dependent transferase, partial [Acinetobacter baumannii]
SRLDHPNMTMLEQRLAMLDGAPEAAVFNSGMAAISTMMQSILRPGQVILHSRPLYGGTDALVHTHLSHFGIRPVGIGDALDPTSVRAAAR